MQELPSRKHPVHGVKTVLNQPTIVFVTVCTEHRQPWLAHDLVHEHLQYIWRTATGWHVGQYLIMPDHIHLVAAPGSIDISLERWCKYWKTQFTLYHDIPEHRWQLNHWDTRIRSAEHYAEKWEYIRNNPIRKGLIGTPDDWPYQGVIFDLPWHG